MKLKPTRFQYSDIFFSDNSDYDDDEYQTFGLHKEIMKPVTNTNTNTIKPFNVDLEMNKAYKRNESKIINETIRPIAPGIYANYNSLNIIVGSQGKGKSHIVLRDIIQISRLKNSNVHLIVYISKNGTINDSTFEAQRELIDLPVQVVSDNNAENYLKELDLWKELYDKYTSVGRVTIDQEKLNKMFNFLHISQRSSSQSEINKLGKPQAKPNTPLNTIILCEDFIKSKLLKSAYFTNYITQLRHKHSIVYVNVQFFKAIPTEFKNNCTSFFIFNGFSRQKMQYIYQQVVMPIDFESLWYRYCKLRNHDFVLVNTREGTIDFVCF